MNFDDRKVTNCRAGEQFFWLPARGRRVFWEESSEKTDRTGRIIDEKGL